MGSGSVSSGPTTGKWLEGKPRSILAEVTEGPQEKRVRRERARPGGTRTCRGCGRRFRCGLNEQARPGSERGLSRHSGGLRSRWPRGAERSPARGAGGGRTIRPSGVPVQDWGVGTWGRGPLRLTTAQTGRDGPFVLGSRSRRHRARGCGRW